MSTPIQSLRRALANIPGLEVAILFGSQASRTARWESDVDLAILLDKPMSADQKRNIIEAVSTEVGCPVDVVDLYGAPEPVLGQVLRGERLLGDTAAYARLMNRHVLNAADFLPLRQRILDERRAEWIE
jgi:predicted nucleotidyltransferase